MDINVERAKMRGNRNDISTLCMGYYGGLYTQTLTSLESNTV
jgi:hypothetical protein